tara:strand:- start:115 stop:339 length:225 start_codon:yes stop_codon:yes gene_type:complete
MKNISIKKQNNQQKLVDIDYLGDSRLSDCLPMVYEGGFSRKKMNEWFYNFTINKHLWIEEFSTCGIPKNSLYYI